MCRTSIIGFPRIGKKRELKFATEKYFKQEISTKELQEVARKIRLENWEIQKKNNISFIPSNDFSFYDSMLDMAQTLNIIPKRYQVLELSKLDTYFAMARGYQGTNGDAKALRMKKWFNTNYHYLVPEFEPSTKVILNAKSILAKYNEAKDAGIKTKSVIIGPYTFLQLSEFKKCTLDEFVNPIIEAYSQLLEHFNQCNVNWVQFDEPFLIHDTDEAQLALFNKLYKKILLHKGSTNVLLQTYFGDVRDSYQHIINHHFDGIGLDFVEGKETLNLLKTYDFPKEKLLFAGVVNGKNIWRNRYQQTLETLHALPNVSDIIISTSCSLQHVPLTIKNETQLENEVLQQFAFAQEKLEELEELRIAYSDNNYSLVEENERCFQNRKLKANLSVQKEAEQLTEADFIRHPKASIRRTIQKDALKLPILPTTTIGSFPQTSDVRKTRQHYLRGEINEVEYQAYIHQNTAEIIQWQEKIGLDVLVHGEFERNDMVEFFGQTLDGFVFSQYGWVQSYGTRCVKPPIIFGDVERKNPITVELAKFAQSQTTKFVKGMLTGPVTILNWSFPREDISIKDSTIQLALAIQKEVLDLEKAGIHIIQIDEAALREKLPLRKEDWYSEYLDWVIPAFRLVHSKVQAKTQIHTHMCYSEFSDIIQSIDDMDADVISFEASRSDLSILDVLKENNFQTQVGPGVYDIHSPRVPSSEEIEEVIKSILQHLPIQQVWINPDCGLKTRSIPEAKDSLFNMIKARDNIIKR
ncbi:MAG: 5-methyltetrahydropteroyltriglutamate--homocysteine S-methyltransferase [Lactobacillales bacterium]|jgi:5-methyltetrahydropteroyltriglutamate--homocysteine methyltransferase|nr:5-methyltetrahydropteroyltriglutamate--homocysteine S-methyltransferase [Lactobacillales bacterium]